MLLLITKKLSLSSVIINESFYTAQSTYYLLWPLHPTLFVVLCVLKISVTIGKLLQVIQCMQRTEQIIQMYRETNSDHFANLFEEVFELNPLKSVIHS